ncbi:type III secretion system chaperone [Hydrogenophaga sp. PBL-H3]|uniref:type III secretion system chaperone n=1 Tax=Hydrogenophaga sp. PBL-H3 TaxID=434010 RepID=UPI00131FF9BE|nr:type III secretion system chaperone [Hydrogenophaga sp. PBL-H3]QHE75367.1 type III secretion system chaperone [Hydrogenophaga sp. PBL-H3]QHE79794.1 type III secretion system chaperone [Hydrogenophaga sp. PBL-H3]
MPSSLHPAPPVERIDTLLKALTDSSRGSTVLHVNDTRVVLRPRDNEPALVMQAHICALPRHSGPRAALCEALLMGNTRLGDSDRLGIEPAENAAVYQRVVGIELDAEALGHELWDLIDAAEQFRHGLGHD